MVAVVEAMAGTSAAVAKVVAVVVGRLGDECRNEKKELKRRKEGSEEEEEGPGDDGVAMTLRDEKKVSLF
jgi:hypothetical protein